MQIDILADIPEVQKRAFEWHQRFNVASNQVDYDERTKRLTIHVLDEQIIEFGSVNLVSIGSSGVVFRALTLVPSGTMAAPISRLICITFN